jgi:tetratricopeptide (TPR) repeat protein
MEKQPESCDACIICALPEEASAFLEMLRPQCEGAIEERASSRYHYSYRTARIKNNTGELLNLHISWLPRYGPQEMALHLDHVLHECQPRITLMTGICAGDAQRVQLGDLVLAERTFTYDNGKFTHDEHGITIHQHETLTYQLDANILQFLGLFDEWKSPVAHLKRPSHVSGRPAQHRKIMCHIKPMASGSAVRADHPFEEIRTPVRGTVAIDMEGAAFGLVMSRHPSIPWLVVKGVCDYANQDKKDAYHGYAARVSALYALSFLRAYMTNEHLPRRDGPPSSNQAGSSSIWTVPYPRNPFFTGREAELQAIARSLQTGQNAAIAQAISGLGGIGKTQTALEYVYRHQSEYHYIFWAIAETHHTLNAAYSHLAELLDLPEKHLTEQRMVVEAVKRWFAVHENWLLILDNADDLSIISDYLPSSISGNLLLTTRAHAMGGLAQRVEIKRLDQEEGSRFLLIRAALLGKNDPIGQADPGDLAQAGVIVRELAGLPLALDQAGAYIEETSCGLQAYLDLYHVHHAELLRTRGGLGRDHPEPIATTLHLCVARVEQINPAAADLLCLCAFLAPDDIPELLLTKGSSKLTPLLALANSPIKLNTAIADLQKYSLIGRTSAKKMLDVHRLVQVVLRDAMTSDVERAWAQRTVRVLAHVFPGPEEMKARETYQQLLAHGQACTALIEQWQMKLIEGAHLLHNVGWYLFERADYQEAQRYYEKAVAMKREVFGEESLDTAASLNNLALVYDAQGKYDDALSLYEHVLGIKRKALGEQHIGITTTLNNLAMLYRAQGKYEKALNFHQQELAITRKALGEHHPDTAKSWGNLANVYLAQGKYDEAQNPCERALAIQREALGEHHPDTATSLNNLALVYRHQGKYEKAAVLHTQALDIRREVLGEQHPDTAASLEGLALVYAAQENSEEAEPLLQQALTIYRSRLSEDHPAVARCHYSLGLLHRAQKRYEEALPLFKKALVIYQEKLGPEHDATRGARHHYEETVRLLEGR